MQDLYDMINDNNYNSYINSINDDDNIGMNINMGETLGFADYLASSNSIYELMDEDDLIDQLEDNDPYEELTPLRSRNNKRDIPIPEFEQYVQKVCGIK